MGGARTVGVTFGRAVQAVGEEAALVAELQARSEEAFAYLRTRANLRDPDEHLRLAYWCQLHGLRKHALEEAKEAVNLRSIALPFTKL